MDQSEALAFGLDADLRQERAQVGLVLLGGGRSRPHEGLLPARFLFRILVGATAVVPIEADPVVVVAHDGRDVALADESDRLVRLGAVADEIPQVIDGIQMLDIDGGQDRFGRGAIAVQVAEDGDAGGHIDVKRARGCDFRETPKTVLTFWHAACTFITSQTRTGAIPEAESQQNADGLDASLDCRRPALGERQTRRFHIVAGRTASAWGSSVDRGDASRPASPAPISTSSHPRWDAGSAHSCAEEALERRRARGALHAAADVLAPPVATDRADEARLFRAATGQWSRGAACGNL